MKCLVPLCIIVSLHSVWCGPKDDSARVGEHHPRDDDSRVGAPHLRRHKHGGQSPEIHSVASEDEIPSKDYQGDGGYRDPDQAKLFNIGNIGDSNKRINEKLADIQRRHGDHNGADKSGGLGDKVLHEEDFDLGYNYSMLLQRYPNCSVCRDRELIKQYQIEVIKDKILSMLRLKAPPNVTGPIPDINIKAIEQYNNLGQERGGKDDNEFVTTGVITVGQTEHSQTTNTHKFTKSKTSTHSFTPNTFPIENYSNNPNINLHSIVYFNISDEELHRGRQGRTKLMLFVRSRSSGDEVLILIYRIIVHRNGTMGKKVVSSLKKKKVPTATLR